jgi:8-amino-7-oxononanoate synthase
VAWATRAALRLVRQGDELRGRLAALVQRFRQGAAQLDLPLMPSDTPIQPLLVGDTGRALRLSEKLHRQGIVVSAIRPPTVAPGAARLRITLSARHRGEQVDRLLDALSSGLRELVGDSASATDLS